MVLRQDAECLVRNNKSYFGGIINLILRILGCGTSTGVPVPACECKVCRSDHPRNKRLRTSALIKSKANGNILIDASTDFRQQALAAGLKKIDGVVLTHAHADHILGIDDLRCFNYVQRSAINCFADTATIDEIQRVFRYVFERDPNYKGGTPPQLVMHEIRMFEPFHVNGLEILPFPLEHGGMQVTGLRVGRMAYVTDVKTIPRESMAVLRNLSLLILDGLRDQPHDTHLTIDEALAIIADLKVPQALLTHMSHTVDYQETSKRLPQNVQLAYDELEVTF